MIRSFPAVLAAALALSAASGAPAQVQVQAQAQAQAQAPAGGRAPSLADRIINTPRPDALYVSRTLQPRPVLRDEPSVQGGKALRIATPADAPNAWTVLASSAIKRPVATGDELVLAFWARLIEGEGGDETIVLPSNAIRLAAAPYTALISGRAEVGRDWALHEVRGVAGRDYAAGEILAVLHLSSGQHTLELGPVFVLDMGPAGSR